MITRMFYDIDTQNDFINKNGALYVPGADEIKYNLENLTAYAKDNKVPIVGSVDNHPKNDPEFKVFPPHCIKRTTGQEKISETKTMDLAVDMDMILPSNKEDIGIYVSNVPKDKIKTPQLVKTIVEATASYITNPGIFFEKQSYDIFTNPSFEKFLELSGVEEAVVYGVATDYCVKAAVLGMQKKGIQCYVVEDAIKGVAPETTQQALDEMVSAGAEFVKTQDVLEGRV